MRGTRRLLGLLFLLLLAVPGLVQAGPPGTDSGVLPNDKTYPGAPSPACTANNPAVANVNVPDWPGPAGTRILLVRVSYSRGNSAYTFTVPAPFYVTEPQCSTGTQVAASAVNQIAAAATAQGFGGAGVPPPPGGSITITAPSSLGAPCGFRLVNNSALVPPSFQVDASGLPSSCSLSGLYLATNGGNTVQHDLLRQYFLQIQANGEERVCVGGSNPGTACASNPANCLGGGVCTDTIVRWKVTPIGGSSTTLSPVNLANFINNSAGLHQALKSVLELYLASLGNDPSVVTVKDHATFSQFPDGYAAGSLIHVLNANSDFTSMGIEVTQGGTGGNLQIVTEGSELNLGKVTPMLNPWGVTALAAVILLSSLWFLRRRFRPVQE